MAVACNKDELAPIGGDETRVGEHTLMVSAGRNAAEGDEPSTRAWLDVSTAPYVYWWDARETILLTVAAEGSTGNIQPIADILNKLPFRGTNTVRATHANFTSDRADAVYAYLQSANSFDYYALYANGFGTAKLTSTNFPNTISFTLGASAYGAATSNTLTAGDFTAAKTPMVAIVKDHEPNIWYETGELTSTTFADNTSDGLHFSFDHTTSYAAIEFDASLFGEGVTVSSLTMTVGSATSAATMINGTYTYNIATGEGTLAGGTNTVEFTGLNLAVGSGQKLYIPMPAKTFTGQTFRFTYTLSNSASENHYDSGVHTVTADNITFERGKIHPLLISPKSAIYTTSDTFTVTTTGYYYIEAWGGNGGDGGNSLNMQSGKGGVAQPVRGLYLLREGDIVNVQIGTAGADGASGDDTGNIHSGGAGGTGQWFGSGATGGNGGTAAITGSSYNSGGGGGGGGAASGVLVGETSALTAENIIIASGGGGGGGGAGGNNKSGGNNPRAGAGGPHLNENGVLVLTGETIKGYYGTYGVGGDGWSSVSTAGSGNTGEINGSDGYNNGSGPWTKVNGGGGGGGGAGGWDGSLGGGGENGTGGSRVVGNNTGGGGGGAAGQSSVGTGESNPAGFTQHIRPAGREDGYVVITLTARETP